MGTSLAKDIKDNIELIEVKPFENPFDPRKRDFLDFRSYLDIISVVAKRIDKIEEHLVDGVGAGRAFIRPEERPDVGAAGIQELSNQFRKLNERLEQVEKRLARG